MTRRVLAVLAVAGLVGCLVPVEAGGNTTNDGGATGGGAAGGGATGGSSGGGTAGGGPTGGGATGGGPTGGGWAGTRSNMLVLLDKSGSMAVPVDPSEPSCTAGCGVGTVCPPTCPSRIDALRAAVDTALTNYAAKFRFGLVAFPNDNLCGQSSGPASIRVPPLSMPTDAPEPLQTQAGLVNTSVQRISSSATGVDLVVGGTPTAVALRQVGELPQLQDITRENFVLLITDGVPNCSASNPNTCLNPTACRCTLANCGTTLAAQFCTLGCLADTETLAAVNALRAKRIRTIVLGVGPETTSDVFRSLANAGGFTRACASDADCGLNDACTGANHTCLLPYFHGSNEAQLRQQLLRIFDAAQ